MDAIFKVNNVYVVVRNKKVREGIDIGQSEELIISKSKDSASLYGGRVYVSYNSYYQAYRFMIDGIYIYKFKSSSYDISLDINLNMSNVAAYLNQIENLGIETFLENYKKQLESVKGDLEGLEEKMLQDLGGDEENKNEKLSVIRESIIKIGTILFALYVNMNAGLQVQDYIDAYNMVINMYF